MGVLECTTGRDSKRAFGTQDDWREGLSKAAGQRLLSDPPAGGELSTGAESLS